MEIFNYHPETGEFIGTSSADPDPLTADNWLIPAHAVTTAPPNVPGQAAIWSNGAWTLIDDHRGQTWFRGHGDPVTITELGDPADQGLVDVEPDPPTPSTDPNDYPLTALEFDAALVRLGINRDDVAPAIRTIFAQDIDAMADSLARWWNLKTMTRDNPVMGMLKPVFNVTDEQIDTAWMATVARRA